MSTYPTTEADFPVTALPLDSMTADSSMMFSSREDKTGVVFPKGQGVPMLGRAGLPAKGYDATVRKIFDLKDYVANSEPGNDFRDRWHVTLFGSVIPDMLDYSRPIYALNGRYTGLIGAARTRHHLIFYRANHLNPIWDAIADYVRTGDRPTNKVSYLP